MKTFPGLSWWNSLRMRTGTRRKESDLGDMGIAIGLDSAMPSLDDPTRLDLQAHGAHDAHEPWQERPTRPTQS